MREGLRRPFPMNNTGRAGEASSTRATRGAPPCAFTSDSRWIQRRLGARIAFLPVPDAEGQRFAGRRSPGREIPHAPQTRSPRLPKHGKRSGRSADRRIRWIEWKAGEIVRLRLRSSAAPGACAHAGHASRTLFANSTAAIFLRSLSNGDISLRSHIPTQIYSYAEYATAEYSYADIT